MPVGSRHRNALTEAWKSKPLGERTSFYSTSVPAEMEPRSRRLFPGSPAPLLPHSRTRRNTASTKALRHQQGWQEPSLRFPTLHQHSVGAAASWHLHKEQYRSYPSLSLTSLAIAPLSVPGEIPWPQKSTVSASKQRRK